MKLVGATNWFIRVPFMLEGLVHGVAGAAISVAGLSIVKTTVFPRIQRIDILQFFRVTSSQVWTTSIWLFIIGCVVGVIGSLWAVSRYLDV
jgi:cell division transport system permease protein